jgi:polyhydroxyalkanoate synthase
VNQAVEAKVDPIGMMTPLLHAQLAWLSHPQEMSEALAGFSARMWDLQVHSWHRALGMPSKDVVSPNPDDTRFGDPVWNESATWDIVKEWYLMLTRQVQDALYDTPGLSNRDRRRAAFWWRKWLNAMAPTNFLLTNPSAMQKRWRRTAKACSRASTISSPTFRRATCRWRGRRISWSARTWRRLRARWCFRNRLLEVIHYTPTREKVHQTHRHRHALDQQVLRPRPECQEEHGQVPGRPGLRRLYHQLEESDGRDARCQLRRLPDGRRRPDHRNGARRLRVGQGACRRLLHRRRGAGDMDGLGQRAIRKQGRAGRHGDLADHLVDYHKPGDIEVFLDENSIKWLEKSMAEKGYLDGKEMASAFRLLRSNSLVWHYVVRGYLFGEAPPPFDVLFWNMDSTRMPATMHSWYCATSTWKIC